jgi:hypothetical protein
LVNWSEPFSAVADCTSKPDKTAITIVHRMRVIAIFPQEGQVISMYPSLAMPGFQQIPFASHRHQSRRVTAATSSARGRSELKIEPLTYAFGGPGVAGLTDQRFCRLSG